MAWSRKETVTLSRRERRRRGPPAADEVEARYIVSFQSSLAAPSAVSSVSFVLAALAISLVFVSRLLVVVLLLFFRSSFYPL